MFSLDNTVLVIVDVQGKLATLMHKKQDLYKNLMAITAGAKELDVPVLWMEQIPHKLGPTITELSELLTEQNPISKSSFSCYGEPEFLKALEQTRRKQVLVVGIEAHICVYQTAMDLHQAGYDVEVVADAVSSRTKQNKNLALEKLGKAGIGITSTEMALFELMKTADAPQFRTVAKLIK
ncbi:isochorismatase [Endozoicomonas montiporae]|uniref:Isochorismatase n=2 Tax=Endozoicomonas montiporae TaxID=1027273 RepID=A0A081MZ03_9GAMM|nr:hydrolase [Endozoicomonas montiporae]AMO54897.1 nicotinamidase-like amidase [Endozoicomonas montiporae CL-33]KEQ11426.1 isochorismatase [Endozoicomonas montiporae]